MINNKTCSPTGSKEYKNCENVKRMVSNFNMQEPPAGNKYSFVPSLFQGVVVAILEIQEAVKLNKVGLCSNVSCCIVL